MYEITHTWESQAGEKLVNKIITFMFLSSNLESNLRPNIAGNL